MHLSRLFPLFLALLLSGSCLLQAEPLDLAIRQFRTSYLSGAGQGLTAMPMPGGDVAAQRLRALKLVETQKEDGSWPDIDYANQARSNWRPYEHVQRLVLLAVQLSGNGLEETTLARLRKTCVRGTAFWRSHDFKCPNWWYNEIGVPQMLGTYALLMGGQLPKGEVDYITGTVLERCGLRMTGQNKVWLAGNTVMQGLLERDETKVAAAAEAIWSEISVSEKEGIQPDWSFHQHGPQLQFGNYGLAFAGEESRWMKVLHETPWALPPEKAETFRNYLLDGLGWVCWQGSMDLGSCGRQIFAGSPQTKARTLRRIFEEMKEVDPAAAQAYREAVARMDKGGANTLVGNRFYWRSEYAIHRGTKLFLSLKMSSARVIGTELVNSENLRGRYLADGMLLLQAKGDEYADIYPVWDWRRLPGTSLAWKEQVPVTGHSNDRLLSHWVGGASDGSLGCAALAYERDGVTASKSWFFFGNSVLCLGAGISGKEPLPVQTTLNQCLLRGPIIATSDDGAVQSLPPGERTFAKLACLDHDGLRYRFYEPASVTVSSSKRTGNWRNIYQNPGTPQANLSKDVFTLWIDHGVHPSDASYAYGVSLVSDGEPPVAVLSNTDGLQAVRWENDSWQAVFWKPGALELEKDLVLKSDQPCLVLAKRSGSSWLLHLADPSHTLRQLKITLGEETRTIELPSGGHAGSTRALAW